MYDVLVIGAGPSGSYASYELSRKGFSVIQLEEHPEVGKPVECTGLVSRRVLEFVRTKSIINRVHGAHVYFPNDGRISISKAEETVVLERDEFDRDVSGMATGAGTELRVNSKVIEVKRNTEGITAKIRETGNIREIKARVVIGADGANSIVRKDLFGKRIQRVVSAYQVESAESMEDQDNVNVYLGKAVTRGYFAWATPAGDTSRIGTACLGGSSKNYFHELNRRFRNNKILSITGGPIPISTLKKTYGERVILVGDAAGIVKPLSGGGIFTGILSGSKAAETMIRALEEDDLSEKNLKGYQNLWKSEIGMELRIDLLIQKMFARITDSSFNSLYEIISRENNKRVINRIGDIDFPSKVVASLIVRNPSLARHILFPARDR
ncbi:MAG: geranylgeranyl reductase family protein [Thermoplasmataceae archaeon]